MNKIRLISLILAIAIVVSVLGGCTSSTLANPVENGEFKYTLVRSNDAGSTVQAAIRELRAAVKSNMDCEVTVIKDSVEEPSDSTYEIIIGESNRPESALAKEALINNRVNNADDFIVKVIGNKIVILALNDKMIDVATKWFVSTFCGSIDDFCQLTTDYEFIYAPESSLGSDKINRVNDVDIARYTVVLPKEISYMVGRQYNLYTEYMEQYGYSIKIGEERDIEETYEILVGDTSREASSTVNVEGDNWVIKVVGNKIVIKGGSVLATYRASEEFYNLNKAGLESGYPFVWSDGYVINGKYDANEENTYTLNFSDDFEGTAINMNLWGDYRYTNKTVGDSALGGKQYPTNIQGQCDIPEGRNQNLIYQADGTLHVGGMLVNDKDFVYGDVSSVDTMVYRYGYIEFRAKLAESPAYTGMWINGSTSTGTRHINRFGSIMNHSAMTEIDVLENFSDENSFQSNVHHWYNLYKSDGITTSGNGHNGLDADSRYTGKSTNNKKYNYDVVKNNATLADDFHLYSCYWDDESIEFAFDGKRFLNYEFNDQEMPSVSCGMLYVIFECGLGSASYGETYNRNKHEARYEAQWDFIKIYQSDRFNSQMVYAGPQAEKANLKYVYPENDVLGNY